MNITYGKRKHRGSLEESLKTKKEISEDEFEKLLPEYKYYAFDKRVNQILFIHKNIQKTFDRYTWLYIQIIE